MATAAPAVDRGDRAGPGWAWLPWLAEPLRLAFQSTRGHALLAHGPAGVGHLEFALQLGQALLCDAPEGGRACGCCASCRLIRQHVHPDLTVVVPEALRVALDWPPDEDAPTRPDAKPSREVRIASVRGAIAWAQKTPARGRAKVLLVHPADALNAHAANALLKTLEEPPASLRLVLTSADPERLLPTLRSRCQLLRLALPGAAQARDWLVAQGLGQPDALLRLAGGSPLEALAWAGEGLSPELIGELPRRIAAGDAAPLAGRPVPRALDLLLRLAHDLGAHAVGGEPRFFATASLPGGTDVAALAAWQRELLRLARHEDHPWQAPLLVESLVAQARGLWPRAAGGRAGGNRWLHSRP